jgi:hypothetical protein
MSRYVVLSDLDVLHDVAAFWPYSSIEKVALWVYAADDLAAAERFAAERFPNEARVVLPLADAEALVRQHLVNSSRRHRARGVA